jgi:hypothetical protein
MRSNEWVNLVRRREQRCANRAQFQWRRQVPLGVGPGYRQGFGAFFKRSLASVVGKESVAVFGFDKNEEQALEILNA